MSSISFGWSVVSWFQKVFDWSSTKKQISGKLACSNGDPLYSYRINLYAKSFFGETKIASTETDKNGKFKLDFWQFTHSFSSIQPLALKVERISEASSLFKSHVLCEVPIKKPYALANYKLKDPIKASILEYDSGSPHPQQPKDPSQIPSSDDGWFIWTVLKAGWDEILKQVGLQTIGKNLSTAEVQNIMGIPETRLNHDSKTIVEMLTNGIYAPPAFLKGENEGELLARINWDKYEIDTSNNAPDIPNVDIVLVNSKNGKDIKQVTIKFPKQKASIYKPDQPDFAKALRIAACMILLKGEIESHLGLGHLIPGEFAMAARRKFIKNPLAKLLNPILEGTLRINHLGGPAIFNKASGALGIAALTQKGIDQVLQDSMSFCDYINWQPAKERFEGDVFAQEKHLFYMTSKKAIMNFLKNHQDEIKKSWHEVYYFSKDLVENSFPYVPYMSQYNFSRWDDASEIGKQNPRDIGRDGIVRAFRAITTNKDSPEDGDWDRLANALAYFFYLSTYYHDKIHKSQKKWACDLRFASLAPRNQSKEDFGGDDEYIGTTPEDARKQLAIAHILTDFDEYLQNKSILLHPEVVKEIKEAFIEALPAFKKLGIDLNKTPISVFI